ncbi:hypothetical protein NMY22_g6955 [Coprinellus aureogranulatus]|nr:hypothetical protein NMY22_g6955 [Coprinellus aureogranulatus]
MTLVQGIPIWHSHLNYPTIEGNIEARIQERITELVALPSPLTAGCGDFEKTEDAANTELSWDTNKTEETFRSRIHPPSTAY